MRRAIAAAAVLAVLVMGGGGAALASAAEKAVVAAPPPAAPAGVALTAQDAEAWLDGFMPYAIQRGDVAGATVSIVKDGQVLLEKGYGYSDVAKRTPVDPKTTMFRPGSVSKLFTWTAVMQQVQAGKLKLDADINTYLDFKIPPYNGQPITLRNLMTHTPGFEEQVKGLITEDPKKIIPLEQALKRWTPKRIFAPGTTPAYSNYGAALAGYIVQRVSGQSFDDYIDQHIFKPLDMNHSSFHQPLQPALVPDVSKGYSNAGVKPGGYEYIPLAPAGSLASTADDMSRFMIAHLQDGRWGSTEILSPAIAHEMHDTPLTIIPGLNRMELGFYEQNINGRRVIGHAGDTEYFHSYLFLYPDDHVGVFVSFNSPGKEGAAHVIRNQLFYEFADRYFPRVAPAPEGQVDAATAAAHAKMMVGLYQNSRRSESSFLELFYFLSQTKVTANSDGTISVKGMDTPGGDAKHYKETSPFLWTEVGGHDHVGAVVKDGKVVRFSDGEISPFMVFDPVPAAISSAWLMPLDQLGLAAILLTLLLWPVAILVRRRYGKSFALEGARAVGYRLVRVAGLAMAAGIVGWFMVVQTLSGTATVPSDGFLHLVQALTVLGFLGGLLAALYNTWAVWTGGGGWFGKLWSAVLVLAFLALAWTGWVFHLISFNVNF